jgi:hypothetical protein
METFRYGDKSIGRSLRPSPGLGGFQLLKYAMLAEHLTVLARKRLSFSQLAEASDATVSRFAIARPGAESKFNHPERQIYHPSIDSGVDAWTNHPLRRPITA